MKFCLLELIKKIFNIKTKKKNNKLKEMFDQFFINNIGQIQIQTFGEQENCSFEEKVWVQQVQWSRLLDKQYKFNPIEKDFSGFNRRMFLTNNLERNQMIDSIKQQIEQYRRIKTGKMEYVHFFILKSANREPSTVFNYKEVKTPKDFKHRFFKLF